jgi:ribonucleoside-diphosphate reductase subunit M2
MISEQVNIKTNDIFINSDCITNDNLLINENVIQAHKIELEYENNKQNDLLKIKHKDFNKNIKSNKTIEIDGNKNKHIDLVYEPLTDPKKRSLNYRKIEHPDIWDNYLAQEAANWKFDEIDFTKDYENFIKLDKPKQKVIKMILSFFANSDGIVNINITNRIMNEITAIEAFTAYSYQVVMENTHNRVYSFLLDLLIKDEKEKDDMFNSIKNINSIKLTSDWAFKWIESDEPLACRIVAFACIEGILFSAAFAFIFWLKENSMGEICMEGLVRSNEFISRDEGLHKDFGIILYKKLKNKPPNQTIIKIIKESVDIGIAFNEETVDNNILGLSTSDMNTYVKYVADRLCYSLIGTKIYNASNPFPFMETIGMQQKTNFHESRVTEYKTANTSDGNNNLELLDDF